MQRRQGKGSGRSRRSGLQLSLNPSTYRKERKMIILNERHFSVDLQGLSKPKPTFPLGEGRVWRGWHGIHRIIWWKTTVLIYIHIYMYARTRTRLHTLIITFAKSLKQFRTISYEQIISCVCVTTFLSRVRW